MSTEKRSRQKHLIHQYQLTLEELPDSYTNTSMGKLKKSEEFLTLRTSTFLMVSVLGMGPSYAELALSCNITKKGLLAIELMEVWQVTLYALSVMSSMAMVSNSKKQFMLEMFLKGTGGSLVFFLAGIFIIENPLVSSSSLRQITFGISHLLAIGRNTGTVFSSLMERVPSMEQDCLTGGILTATLNSALSFFLILKCTSSQYSKRSVLLTEQTYSSRSLNSLLWQVATIRRKKEEFPLSSRAAFYFKLTLTSISSMEPGKRGLLLKLTVLLVTSMRSLVNNSSSSSSFWVDTKLPTQSWCRGCPHRYANA